MARIELDKVSLTFRVRPFGRITLKEFLISRLRGRAGTRLMKVRALQDVSLAIGEGERVGIIGHNGAGKSTLLRLLAGIYPPTRGRRAVEGRISSLFDISLGFEAEATGWENIAYRSFLQGETPASVRRKKKAIAEFSELGEFLRIPVRNYSAGMVMRLAFAIATSIEPEILLVDEVLAVGDLAFQRKAKARVEEMMSAARLMVMVSHDLGAIKSMCNRAIWMQHGAVMMDGKPDEVVKAYQNSVAPPAAAEAKADGGEPHVGGLTAAA